MDNTQLLHKEINVKKKSLNEINATIKIALIGSSAKTSNYLGLGKIDISNLNALEGIVSDFLLHNLIKSTNKFNISKDIVFNFCEKIGWTNVKWSWGRVVNSNQYENFHKYLNSVCK